MAKFDPRNIENYLGKTFVTESSSSYYISNVGTIMGRKSINCEQILMIAGIEDNLRLVGDIKSVLGYDPSMPGNKKELDRLILKYGQEVKEGLRLVISLTEKGIVRTGRNGMLTSKIKDIE